MDTGDGTWKSRSEGVREDLFDGWSVVIPVYLVGEVLTEHRAGPCKGLGLDLKFMEVTSRCRTARRCYFLQSTLQMKKLRLREGRAAREPQSHENGGDAGAGPQGSALTLSPHGSRAEGFRVRQGGNTYRTRLTMGSRMLCPSAALHSSKETPSSCRPDREGAGTLGRPRILERGLKYLFFLT